MDKKKEKGKQAERKSARPAHYNAGKQNREGRKRVSIKARRRKQILIKRIILGVSAVVLLLLLIGLGMLVKNRLFSGKQKNAEEEILEQEAVQVEEIQEVEEEEEPNLPKIDITSWEYVLADRNHPLGEYAPPEIVELEGVPLDSRIVDAMQAFVEGGRAAGVDVYMSSGYRDYDTQQYLLELKMEQGYSEEEASRIVAPPGTSEHQTGLSCDIMDHFREILNEELEETETYKWLCNHCWEYGFIVRYPLDKKDITGIIYEPWHFRYVGKEAAEYIMNNHLCLEEFLALYK